MPRTRSLAPLAAALALALATGCHETVGPLDAPPPLAMAASDRFSALAESLSVAGADPALWHGYYNLARVAVTAGQATPVYVEIDGELEEFVAMAERVGGGVDCRPDPRVSCPQVGLVPPGLRVLTAWKRDDPSRVVQVTTREPTSHIIRPDLGAEPFAAAGTLVFLDGKGGFFTATSGDAAISVSSAGDTPCYVPRNIPLASNAVAGIWNPVTCTDARLAVGFTAEASRPAIGGPRENSAAGTHHVALRLQSIPGSLVNQTNPYCPDCVFGAFPYMVRPPLDPRSQVLTATLAAQVKDSVTLTFTVTNPTSAPVQITHADAQRFDLAIVDAGSGAEVWRWSADKLFAQVMSTETLAPGASLVFTGTWTPRVTMSGQYFAEARLVSPDQLATAGTMFSRP